MQTKKNKGISRTSGQIQKVLRNLPSIEAILITNEFEAAITGLGREFATSLLREILEEARGRILEAEVEAELLKAEDRMTPEALAEQVMQRGSTILSRSPVPVINASGIVVHTNLGRSILSPRAAREVAAAGSAYMNLEYDLAGGKRGSRLAHFDALMERLFPGTGFLIVNNNAAGILIALRAIAQDREVVISRGELVEIGGSFRVPDIFAASGARLREVGTTNRTRLADYQQATDSETGAWLKVHTSNFKIIGFTQEPTLDELAAGAKEFGIPLIVDWGSGELADLGPLGIADELPVRKILEIGADLVTFSGDKLLGGPQAGFVVGKKDLIEKLRKDPMARVCRLDRLKICALRETLAAYVRGTHFEEIPTLRMLKIEPGEIGVRAKAVIAKVTAAVGADADDRLRTMDGVSRSGGGSSPLGERPTVLLVVEGRDGDEGRLEAALRTGSPAVVGRVQDGNLLLDLRTVAPDQDQVVVDRLRDVLKTSQ
jgi:L-seryl-tRNA(Ser) seleniumtransferase